MTQTVKVTIKREQIIPILQNVSTWAYGFPDEIALDLPVEQIKMEASLPMFKACIAKEPEPKTKRYRIVNARCSHNDHIINHEVGEPIGVSDIIELKEIE